jgi:diaminohydroxyphosphoribosylaminopyrimidine deaminase / 5-amino-6-(5-phosphoribosylamino)uracil reductase
MADDRLYDAMIKKALRLALKGEGYTSPNPMVGAVVFDQNGIIAAGYHQKVGGPHAEVLALRRAGEKARGASLAINLEPCCHVGRTGPCTDAILQAGIKKVIFSIEDPFTCVCGRGARFLVNNGIEVISGVGREEATRLNEVYLKFITTGKPFVVLKTAQTLDGRIATRTGDSKWISGPESLTFAHRLRARYDAVAVGSGTVKADNPQLTVRNVKGRNPFRIVITSTGKLPTRSSLLVNNQDNKTIVATTRTAARISALSSTTTWMIRRGKGGISLKHFLETAAHHDITSILVEGGGRLATALIRERLVDKLYLVIAPMIMGRGIDTIADLGVKRLADAMRFDQSGSDRLGTDILFWGYPRQ